MASDYEYYVRPDPDRPQHPPLELWRRAGQRWQYYSLLDWSWHDLSTTGPPWVPEPDWLEPVDPAYAEALATDRQRWVRYWARYLDPPTGEADRPLTVLRRRRSPERRLDESFTIDNRWQQTRTILDSELPQVSDPPRLVEIDRDTAEEILREVRGVEGATDL